MDRRRLLGAAVPTLLPWGAIVPTLLLWGASVPAASAGAWTCPCIGDTDGVLGPALPPSGWVVSGGCARPEPSSDGWVLGRPDGCDLTSYLLMDPRQASLCGDFDVSVDFEAVDLPPAERGGIVLALDLLQVTGTEYASVQRPSRQERGALRITRRGRELTLWVLEMNRRARSLTSRVTAVIVQSSSSTGWSYGRLQLRPVPNSVPVSRAASSS